MAWTLIGTAFGNSPNPKVLSDEIYYIAFDDFNMFSSGKIIDLPSNVNDFCYFQGNWYFTRTYNYGVIIYRLDVIATPNGEPPPDFFYSYALTEVFRVQDGELGGLGVGFAGANSQSYLETNGTVMVGFAEVSNTFGNDVVVYTTDGTTWYFNQTWGGSEYHTNGAPAAGPAGTIYIQAKERASSLNYLFYYNVGMGEMVQASSIPSGKEIFAINPDYIWRGRSPTNNDQFEWSSDGVSWTTATNVMGAIPVQCINGSFTAGIVYGALSGGVYPITLGHFSADRLRFVFPGPTSIGNAGQLMTSVGQTALITLTAETYVSIPPSTWYGPPSGNTPSDNPYFPIDPPPSLTHSSQGIPGGILI